MLSYGRAMDVSCSVSGHGDPYLLLHGGGGPMSVAGFAALLSEHGRVVAPTHPGFGGTERPASMDSVAALAGRYVDLLEELDLTGVCVIGNSLGGWVAAEMALLDSSRIRSLVVVDAVGIEVAGHPVPDFFALTPAEVAARSWYDPSRMVDPATLPPAVRATLPGNRAALAVYGGTMADPGLVARLSAVTVPTLVAWGEADRIGDTEYGRAFAAAIPGARFELIPRAGHLPQIEAPDALLTLVRDFTDDHAAAPSPS